jgi:cytochrome c-type biogenesis protein CcmF
VTFKRSGRESFILGNNVLLTVSAAVVLLGTLYPLGFEALTGGDKISIGPPYFNAVFVPLMLALMALMILSHRSRWWATARSLLTASQGVFSAIALVAAVGLSLVMGPIKFWILGVAWLAAMILLNLGYELYRRVRRKSNRISRLLTQPLAVYAMVLGHAGIAVTALGIVTTVMLSEEADLYMAPGDRAQVGAYEVRFYGTNSVQGPNYVADQGRVEVSRAGELITTLFPEKRRYLASQSIMTEADIHVRSLGDIYVALGEPLENGAWAVRVHIKPLVRFIWFGGVLIALGGVISIFDRRYRVPRARASRKTSLAPRLEPANG